jgi:hypothetical protein
MEEAMKTQQPAEEAWYVTSILEGLGFAGNLPDELAISLLKKPWRF